MESGSAKLTIAPPARLNFPASSIFNSRLGTAALVECHFPVILLKAQFTKALPSAEGGGFKHQPSEIPFKTLQRANWFGSHAIWPRERPGHLQMFLADMAVVNVKEQSGGETLPKSLRKA
jgi:hypothetical protein